MIRQSRRESRAVQEEYDQVFGERGKRDAATRSAWLLHTGAVVLGLALLVVGARWLVDAAVTIARAAGLSESVIRLTIVAAGTSLPEVAASVIATLRGERDIAVGNVIGSNLWVIARWEGALFLGLYAAYTTYLVLDSQEHDVLPAYSRTLLLFVLPLVAVTIVGSSLRALRTERRADGARRT